MEPTQNKAVEPVSDGKTGSEVPKKLSIALLFENGLREMYAAEKLLIDSLPGLGEACSNDDLRHALKEQHRKTSRQEERLDNIFVKLGMEKGAAACRAVEVMLEEALELRSNAESSPVRDAALIITLQKIEHYQIAAYGSLCELADLLGFGKIANELDRSLEEEEFADHLLTNLAWVINDDALESPQQEKPGA